jgi:SUN domain-containing protein 1/2
MDGPSLAKLLGLILLVFWAGLAVRHTWREIQETINSISGVGRSTVGLPPAQDLAGDSTWKYYHDETVQRLDGQAGEIKEIEGRLRSLTTQVQSAATGLTRSELDRSQRDVRTEFQKLRAEDQVKIGKEIEGVNGAVMRLKEEMNRLKSETGKGNTEVMKELRRIETLMKDHKRSTSNDMSEVKARLSKVETEMLKMFDEKLWKQTLERILPTFVPFHRDGSGKMRVDPLFWTEMKKMFASERSVTDSAPRQQPDHQPSWKDFIEENDEKLKRWLQNSLGDKAFYTESMHSGVFQDLLDDEVAKLKGSLLEDMRARAAEGDKKVKRELDQMRTEAREAAGLRWGQKVSDEVLVDSAFSVQQLIDHALLTYSKDTIAKADYALASSGSTVLNHQTSPSLELTRPGFLGRMWGRKARARDPRVALQGLNDPGYCWAFAGSKGSLGIGLASRIRVTDITIEHAARELVPKSALSSAPRDVEMVSWRLFSSRVLLDLKTDCILSMLIVGYPRNSRRTPEDRELARVEPVSAAESMRGHAVADLKPRLNSDHQGNRIAPAPGALLLMTAEYDPHTERPLQTFQVPHQIQELGVVTENVVTKFNENWGAEYTCLYRVSGKTSFG